MRFVMFDYRCTQFRKIQKKRFAFIPDEIPVIKVSEGEEPPHSRAPKLS